MSTAKKLSLEQLYRHCDLSWIPFQNSDEVNDANPWFHQDRAYSAARFGINMPHKGYNLFVLGNRGAGKRTFIQQLLKKQPPKHIIPADWVYVFNFKEDIKPRAISLQAGEGIFFKANMEQLLESLLDAIPRAFQAEEYQQQISSIEKSFVEKRDSLIQGIRQKARQHSIDLVRTPKGLIFMPMHENKILDEKSFALLPETQRKELEQVTIGLDKELEVILQEIPKLQEEARKQIKQINAEFTLQAVSYIMQQVMGQYQHHPEILDYLHDVQNDVITNAEIFVNRENTYSGNQLYDDGFLRRYLVNLFVDHSQSQEVPIVELDNPTHDKLLGKVENISQMGVLSTDFTLIRPGALHKANGGFLIIDAYKLLTNPMAWDALKRCLLTEQINIQTLGETMGLIHTVTIEPEPIKLALKVILIGDRQLYYALCEIDPDFKHLFKVEVDFDERTSWSQTQVAELARLIAKQAQQLSLKPFSNKAVARIIEAASRQSENKEKLSTHLGFLNNLLMESDYWAGSHACTQVDETHIEQALQQQQYRSNRVEERIRESILDQFVHIDTQGKQIGQINGLTVIELGGYEFGQASRVTATVRLGDGKFLDIENEAELAGDIHTKGMLILTSYFSHRYSRQRNLPISASLVFEQSYSLIDGDSASVAELMALLSALCQLPLRQDLAVTGSIDQYGRVQAIGAVNEKIEGFFMLCQQRGLNGEQGVVIPASNVSDLMLSAELRQAVHEGKFHLYSIEHADEAWVLFSGLPAEEPPEAEGSHITSANARIMEALEEYHKLAEEEEKEHKEESPEDPAETTS